MTTSIEKWGDVHVEAGTSRNVFLDVGETYSGITVRIPVHVRRGDEDGPVIFVTAAVHGDEVNGTGAIRQLIRDPDLDLSRGAVIFVPVVNPLAFDRHSRYMPDRRDLNRCFPGRRSGSLASRLAHTIFSEIVHRSDAGIDLHTAAVRRTNYPTVRGDLSVDGVRELAEAFGTEVILDKQGPDGSFRREACNVGCPTISLEAGEVWKVEPAITTLASRGVLRVLEHFDMLDTPAKRPSAPRRPPIPVTSDDTTWVRADAGGFLSFHIRPGDVVREGQALATSTTLLGDEVEEEGDVLSPTDGIVIGMSTLPAAHPGTPICHIAKLPPGITADLIERRRARHGELQEQIRTELAANIRVEEDT
ncbi:succinate dehydrogenase [Longibacter salinarum]|uniref:Succinate dehydrogenase n=1 Tax=Longibacter salinarum TaxID=1850348 RepID=A0A2A8D219_9BACT|nr:succinylglutamate desuccinylase/aspartoacylase family protein [Longibacter salinarum]PEN14966.1 succinate dehydrogenase [Longibacter salinarum]